METGIPEVKQLGKIKDSHGAIIIDHYIERGFIVIEQSDVDTETIFIEHKNIEKLITILKKWKE